MDLASMRRQSISFRRYLAPQREAFNRLYNEKTSWLNDMDRLQLREIADRTTRFVEDLDEVRDRAAVTHEELGSRLAEQLNKRMYVLSIVAAIFLPLGFVTGLLGINVGGIPGAENKSAFLVVCAMLGVVALGIGVLFKFKKWF
jgi:zinc transporter